MSEIKKDFFLIAQSLVKKRDCCAKSTRYITTAPGDSVTMAPDTLMHRINVATIVNELRIAFDNF